MFMICISIVIFRLNQNKQMSHLARTGYQNNQNINIDRVDGQEIENIGDSVSQHIWKKSQPMKPCEKYGLDPKKLENEELMKLRSYRRLYNVVVNDQTTSDLMFRPNLIRELYFLLQITPFIENSLREGYLNQIEELYNSNDHKKIKLSKHLDGKISNALLSKSKYQIAQKKTTTLRPKSGVQWDKTLNSFLRPYTAKIRNKSQHNNRIRPESSKYGVSTNANTFCDENEREEDIDNCGNQEQMNIEELEEICDIEEEWKRSLDFKKKFRTLHPEEDPTYQRLMQIVDQHKQKLEMTNKQETPKSFQSYKRLKILENQQRYKKQQHKHQIYNAIIAAQQQIKEIQNANSYLNQNQYLNSDDQQNLGQFEDQDEENGDEEDQQMQGDDEDLVGDKKKLFFSDKRTKQGRKLNLQSQNRLYSNLNGFKIVRPYTAKEQHVLSRLAQYSSIQQNKRVVENKLDEECADKFREYMRKKNSIKRESLRKSQTKSYMSTLRQFSKILPSQNKPKKIPQTISISKQDNTRQQNKTQEIEKEKDLEVEVEVEVEEENIRLFGRPQKNNTMRGKVYNFSTSCKTPGNASSSTPFRYNVKQYFQGVKNQKIAVCLRGINQLEGEPISNSANCSRIVSVKKYSDTRFDPLSQYNLQEHNREALEEIQKIKSRLGGKLGGSTEMLMKALYVDAIRPEYKNQDKQNCGPQQNEKQFLVPDKRYLMTALLKDKKQKRKLKKPIKKKPNK